MLTVFKLSYKLSSVVPKSRYRSSNNSNVYKEVSTQFMAQGNCLTSAFNYYY